MIMAIKDVLPIRRAKYWCSDEFPRTCSIPGPSMADQTCYVPTETLVKRIARGEMFYNDQSLDIGDFIDDKDVHEDNVHPLDRKGNDDFTDVKRIKDEAYADIASADAYFKARDGEAKPQPVVPAPKAQAETPKESQDS